MVKVEQDLNPGLFYHQNPRSVLPMRLPKSLHNQQFCDLTELDVVFPKAEMRKCRPRGDKGPTKGHTTVTQHQAVLSTHKLSNRSQGLKGGVHGKQG